MKVFLAVALVGLLAASTQAAVIEVKPVVAGYFDSDFNPIPDGHSASPVVVQVDVMMQVLSLAPGEDSFGTAAFSFDLYSYDSTLVPDPDAGGWAPNSPVVDSNGALPGGLVPIFATNGDLGVDSQDLQGILVQMATGAFTNAVDPRRNVGEPGSPLGVPILLGSAFLEWSNNSCYGVGITLNPLNVSVKLTNGAFVPAVGVTSSVRMGVICPEPSSAVLLGSCLVGVVLRRRVG